MHTDRTPIGAAAIVSALFSALWITLLFVWLVTSRNPAIDRITITTHPTTTITTGAGR